MFFGTSVAGIPGTLVGLCIAIGTVWDAVTDPIVGYVSDNSINTNIGKRQNYILIASFFMAISNLLIWCVPLNLSNWQKFVWLLSSLLIYETADTFFATPYSALGYELTNDSSENTSIQAYKSVFYLIGMILPSLLMLVFMPDTTSRIGYIKIGLCCSLLIIICTLTCILCLRKKSKSKIIVNLPKFYKKRSFFEAFSTFFEFFKNKRYFYVILAYSVSTLSTALLTSLGMHVFTYSFHFSSSQISTLLLCLLGGAMLSQVFMTKIACKLGKIKTLVYFITLTILGVGMIAILFMFRTMLASQINFYICIPLLLISGFGSGSLYSLPFSIFSDIISKENNNKKTNQTATYSGIITFVFKISNALSLFIIGFILDIIKFDSSQPVQPMIVQNALGNTMIIGVALSLALSILLFKKYEK